MRRWKEVRDEYCGNGAAILYSFIPIEFMSSWSIHVDRHVANIYYMGVSRMHDDDIPLEGLPS